jgi:hypothetical protein
MLENLTDCWKQGKWIWTVFSKFQYYLKYSTEQGEVKQN